MLSFIALSVFLLSFNALVHAATPYKDCGSELGTVTAFQVTDCNAAPCKFVKGNTYAMNVTFTAKAPSKTGSVSVHGIIGGIPVPFPIPGQNVCDDGVKCPVASGDTNTASLSLKILSSYPAISLYAKIEIIADDQKHDYVCVEFPAVIVGSNQARKLVGWESGKLFDMLN